MRLADRMEDALSLVADTFDSSKPWFDEHLKATIQEAVRLRALHEVDRFWRELEPAARVSESPIELAMLAALYVTGIREWDLVVMEPEAGWLVGHPVRPEANYRLTIASQAQLGDYRVDFLLTGAVRHYHTDERGHLGSYAGTTERRMVVECDGFDFHDRTRQQASHDRARDRWLQSFGVLVYRYTGGDIWSDVFRHAQEAVSVLMEVLTDE